MGATRIVLGLVLVLCLALLAHWAMPSDDSGNAPVGARQVASIDGPSGQTQAPAIGAAGVAGAASTQVSASARGTLRGRVMDAVTREPVREFELELHWARRSEADNGPPGARAFGANDGRFEWHSVLPGRWIVIASARGYQRLELMNVTVAAGATTPELAVPLRPGYTLRGRVYDEVSGAGIASARVRLREAGFRRLVESSRLRVQTSSQSDGSFVLEGVPPGRVTLETRAPGYVARQLDVTVSSTAVPVKIGLSAGGSIAGRVVAADGLTPVVGTAAVFNQDQGFGHSIETDAAGRFLFLHLAPGLHSLKGEARGAAVTQEITLARNQHIEGIVLALKAAHSIRGVVTGLRPELLKEVTVSVSRADGVDFPSAYVRVDARGAYALHGVQPGRVQVRASVNMRRAIVRSAEVPAEADITVDLDFPAGSRLSGRVTRAGKPVPGVFVVPLPSVRQHDSSFVKSTSEQGEYAIDSLPDGEYTVRVDGYRSQPFQISGDTVFNIEVPEAQLSGRVVEAGGEVPVAGAEINVWSAEPGSPPIRLLDSSDALGQFELVGMESGDFLVTVYKPGYELFRERISYLSPILGKAIPLHQSRGVEIKVHEAGSGEALQRVFAMEMGGDLGGIRLQLNLDENGVGYVPGGLAGSSLTFFAQGHVSVVIHEWNGQPLDLQLAQSVE